MSCWIRSVKTHSRVPTGVVKKAAYRYTLARVDQAELDKHGFGAHRLNVKPDSNELA